MIARTPDSPWRLWFARTSRLSACLLFLKLKLHFRRVINQRNKVVVYDVSILHFDIIGGVVLGQWLLISSLSLILRLNQGIILLIINDFIVAFGLGALHFFGFFVVKRSLHFHCVALLGFELVELLWVVRVIWGIVLLCWIGATWFHLWWVLGLVDEGGRGVN